MHRDPADDGPPLGAVDVAVRPVGPEVHVVEVRGDVEAAPGALDAASPEGRDPRDHG
ncbi:MAG: hypothetical protein QOE59_3632 [Actinomycetota bacterium]|nr:hypothetical protein [Actinomycetota bacterium]